MKKIYTLIAATLVLATAANAQTKKINLRFTIVTPANGATIVAGTALTQKVIITNLGPGVIAAADTVFMHDPFNNTGEIWFYLNHPKAVNDTIQLTKSYTPSTSNTNGVRNYCVYGYVMNGSTITSDSTGSTPSQTCNSVTFTGGVNSGIANIGLTENVATENLNIFPNPATGSINVNYTAKNNSELTARVVDITGRVVMTHSYGKVFVGQSNFKLELSTLKAGIYFVDLRQEGARAVGKVTLQ